MRRRPQNGNGLRRHPCRSSRPAVFRAYNAMTDGSGQRMKSHADGAFYTGSSPHQPLRRGFQIPRQEAEGVTLHKLRNEIQAVEAALRHLEGQINHMGGRSPDGQLKAAVDPKQCVACGICEAVCPEGAIALNTTAHVDFRRCLGCGSCASACPQGAISLYSQPEAAEAS